MEKEAAEMEEKSAEFHEKAAQFRKCARLMAESFLLGTTVAAENESTISRLCVSVTDSSTGTGDSRSTGPRHSYPNIAGRDRFD